MMSWKSRTGASLLQLSPLRITSAPGRAGGPAWLTFRHGCARGKHRDFGGARRYRAWWDRSPRSTDTQVLRATRRAATLSCLIASIVRRAGSSQGWASHVRMLDASHERLSGATRRVRRVIGDKVIARQRTTYRRDGHRTRHSSTCRGSRGSHAVAAHPLTFISRGARPKSCVTVMLRLSLLLMSFVRVGCQPSLCANARAIVPETRALRLWAPTTYGQRRHMSHSPRRRD